MRKPKRFSTLNKPDKSAQALAALDGRRDNEQTADVVTSRKERASAKSDDEYEQGFRLTLRLHRIEEELRGPIALYRKRTLEREAQIIHNWITSPMRRKAAEWHRPLWRAALRVHQQNPDISLARLLDDSAVSAAHEGISRKSAHEFLARVGFGRRKPGRPKKTP